jgi:hypothetical protein
MPKEYYTKLRNFKIRREIEQGEMMPKLYGVAYMDFMRKIYICYPFPLNHIVRVYRSVWCRVRHAYMDEMESRLVKREQELKRQEEGLEKLRKFIIDHSIKH